MNKFLILFICSCILYSCDIRNKSNADVQTSDSALVITDSTTVQLIDSLYDFGKITDGEKVEYNFRFKNSGKNPLIITNAAASCGCTVPEKPLHPIKPGETGFIKVVFDSKGRVGDAHKEIFVASNANPGFPTMAIKGQVLEAKK